MDDRKILTRSTARIKLDELIKDRKNTFVIITGLSAFILLLLLAVISARETDFFLPWVEGGSQGIRFSKGVAFALVFVLAVIISVLQILDWRSIVQDQRALEQDHFLVKAETLLWSEEKMRHVLYYFSDGSKFKYYKKHRRMRRYLNDSTDQMLKQACAGDTFYLLIYPNKKSFAEYVYNGNLFRFDPNEPNHKE